MTTKEYQNILYNDLKNVFPFQDITNEWSAFTGRKHQYSPRVDLAIGPFNVQSGINQSDNYDQLVENKKTKLFLRKAFDFHIVNLDTTLYEEIVHPNFDRVLYKNSNARCLIAIEIENQNTKKHIMGSLINAASLGRIGIGVAFNKKTLTTFCRIANYLSFLKRVEKNTYDVTNFLILTVDQLQSLTAQDK